MLWPYIHIEANNKKSKILGVVWKKIVWRLIMAQSCPETGFRTAWRWTRTTRGTTWTATPSGANFMNLRFGQKNFGQKKFWQILILRLRTKWHKNWLSNIHLTIMGTTVGFDRTKMPQKVICVSPLMYIYLNPFKFSQKKIQPKLIRENRIHGSILMKLHFNK
jgi:hypothetical protein